MQISASATKQRSGVLGYGLNIHNGIFNADRTVHSGNRILCFMQRCGLQPDGYLPKAESPSLRI
jgi:hypothetical protein